MLIIISNFERITSHTYATNQLITAQTYPINAI